MSFSFSKIGTKRSIAKHLISSESQLVDDPKSLAAILPLLTGADDSTNYELTASGHGGQVGSLTLRSVGAIVTVLLVLAVTSTAHARWRIFGRNSGCQQQAACPCQQPCPCDPTPQPPPKPIPVPPAPAPVPALAPVQADPGKIPPLPVTSAHDTTELMPCGLFFNRGNGGGCPSCANGQCPNGQCSNCPAAPAIVQPPCDACGDKICRPPENLPSPKPIPATACEPATVARRPVRNVLAKIVSVLHLRAHRGCCK